MRKIIIISIQIGLLFLCNEVGTYLSKEFHLMIPGSVLGMILLFVLLCTKVLPSRSVASGATFMMAFLPLFFIPITVGVMHEGKLLSFTGVGLMIAIVISSFLAVGATGWVSHLLSREKGVMNNE
ncbi:holin-like protein [Fictibacillus macauensis ZFHKF-1]|uniref:Holin-like protein n=1 Tax=Fictibacillus macauensis ZFHKF-1 TaxID=1196324 RepID=I8AJ49_9BACL|nr:CidA/LrgA family protein [Fictibacillus macauensis]EIT85509.1 holin-like protein [Fictibacillus macauensis ZFHKF-1]